MIHDRPILPVAAPRPGISRWLEAARLEIVPVEGVDERVRQHVDRSRTVTVTCSPRSGVERTLDVAAALRESGYDVVPHIAARTIASPAQLHATLTRAERAGVRDLFVIGGDGPPSGAYPSALALLSAAAEGGHAFSELGVAGYPEGHPSIDSEVLLAELVEKQGYATYIVTQMCFDPRAVLGWIEVIRERGVHLPVYVGFPGTVKLRRLLSLGSTIGVGDSLGYLRKNGTLLRSLLHRRGFDPGPFLAELAPGAENPEYGIEGFHVFTFNTLAETQRSLARIARSASTP
jgi:methylenetetrahydrofolate reductase (NADPH)